MFCGECGAKNDKNSKFCEKCGSKLEVVEETKEEKKNKENVKNENKVTETNESIIKEPRKKLPTKYKVIIGIVVVICLLLGIGYKVGSDLTSPKHIAKEYIEAVINSDADKLYEYLNLDGDKTFVSKKIFKDAYEKNASEKSNVENYKITEVSYGKEGLTAKVKFTYTVKNSSNVKTASVDLVKENGKKYFIFDKWKIGDVFESATLKDYTIKAPKDTKITFAGVELTDKYLDKKESTTTQDVYVLPLVFTTKNKVEAELNNGIKVEKDVTPSNYRNSYTVEFDKDDLSNEEKEKLVDDFKNILTDLYTNAIEGKKYDEIKDKYSDVSKEFQENYDDFVDDLLNASTVLKKIEFKNGNVYSIDLDDDSNLEVEVKISYDYTVEYKIGEEVKTSDKSDSDYMTLVLSRDKDGYKLIDIDDVDTYFYR